MRQFFILATLICQLSFRPILAAPPPNYVAGVPINDESRDFARQLAVEGDTVVVGNRTSVQVYERDPADGIWMTKQTIEMAGEVISVDLAGPWIAIGIKDDGYRVELYRATEEGWQLHQTVTAPADVQAEFGSSVVIEDDWFAVGAPESFDAEPNSGGVYLYRLTNERWQLTQTLSNAMPDLGERFGSNVKISGSHLAVSMLDKQELSIRNLYAGVCVYVRDDDEWSYAVYLEPARPELLMPLVRPRTFAVTQEWAVLGGLSEDGGGVLFVFDRTEESWRIASRVQEPRPSFTSLGYQFEGNARVFVTAALTDRHQQSLHMYLNEHDGIKFIGSIEGLRLDDRTSTALAISDEYIIATGVVPYGDEVHSAVLAWPIPTALYTTLDEIDSMSREEVMRYLVLVSEQKNSWKDVPQILSRLTERYNQAFQRLNELSDGRLNSEQRN